MAGDQRWDHWRRDSPMQCCFWGFNFQSPAKLCQKRTWLCEKYFLGTHGIPFQKKKLGLGSLDFHRKSGFSAWTKLLAPYMCKFIIESGTKQSHPNSQGYFEIKKSFNVFHLSSSAFIFQEIKLNILCLCLHIAKKLPIRKMANCAGSTVSRVKRSAVSPAQFQTCLLGHFCFEEFRILNHVALSVARRAQNSCKMCKWVTVSLISFLWLGILLKKCCTHAILLAVLLVNSSQDCVIKFSKLECLVA